MNVSIKRKNNKIVAICSKLRACAQGKTIDEAIDNFLNMLGKSYNKEDFRFITK